MKKINHSAFFKKYQSAKTIEEKQSLLKFLSTQRAVFKATPEDAQKAITAGLRPISKADPVELAAWTSVCRVALNLHESITRY